MDEGLAEYALKISKARYIEIRIERRAGNEILYIDELKGIDFYENYGFSIRVMDKGMGFYFSNVVTKEKIKEGIEKAEKMARLGEEIKLSDEKMYQDKYEVKGSFPDIEEKIEYIRDLDKLAKERKTFSYNDEVVEKIYMNSEGSFIYSKIPKIYLSYLVTVTNGRIEQMHREFGNTGGWNFIKKWKVEDSLQHDINFLKKLIEEGKKPPSYGDVILSPYIAGLIAHESCGHPFEADRILGREAAQAGKSYASPDMLGKEFANECISIVDDPTLPNSYGFYKYDDEGIKARKRYLIKDGIINEFLHNRETAYKMNCKSNAACRCTYGKEPIIRMANTYFMPADYSLDEMMEDIKSGIYMKTFMEWNIDDTRQNQKYVGQEAYIIRKGEMEGIARHPAIEISTFDFYKKVDAVGKNLEFYPATCGKGDPMQGIEVSTGGADIRLRNVKIK